MTENGPSIERRTLLAGLGAGTLSAALSAPLVAPAAQAAGARARTAFWKSYTRNGLRSYYHVYADGINWSKPVGALYYFDGDHYDKRYSYVHNPTGKVMRAMAAEANRRNLLFIGVVSPDTNRRVNGYTWWENTYQNGQWLRGLGYSLNIGYKLDLKRIWMMGYSGGAEFITYELAARRQTSWMHNGGAIIIGGGGADTMYHRPSTGYKALRMNWFIGSKDVAGQTNPPTWSAMNAAKEGYAFYRKQGFSNAKIHTLSGIGHHGYNMTSCIQTALNNAGVKRLR